METGVGLYINALPVRVAVDPSRPVVDWLQDLQRASLELRRYEYSSLAQVQAWSEIPAGRPLFESLFVYENFPVGKSVEEQEGPLAARDLHGWDTNSFPLSVAVVPGAELSLQINYDTDRFEAETVERLMDQFLLILERIVRAPGASVGSLDMLSESERRRVLVEWNATAAEYPADCCIHELFEAQVEKTPEAVAVVFEEQRLTYRELNERANQLGHHLRSLGVGPEVLVGLCVERSLEMVVGLLGILKAGGAYVPLDPTYPKERLSFLLEDTGAPVLLTQARLALGLPEHRARVLCLDTEWEPVAREHVKNPASGAGPDNLAYVIYTSGSTGKPKGVLGTHRSAVNRFAWMWEAYSFQPGEVCCQKTTLSFVDAVWEVFGPLLRGVPAVLVPDAVVKDVSRFVRALADARITRLVVVPSLLRAMLDLYPDSREPLAQPDTLDQQRRGAAGRPVRAFLAGGAGVRAAQPLRLLRGCG